MNETLDGSAVAAMMPGTEWVGATTVAMTALPGVGGGNVEPIGCDRVCSVASDDFTGGSSGDCPRCALRRAMRSSGVSGAMANSSVLDLDPGALDGRFPFSISSVCTLKNFNLTVVGPLFATSLTQPLFG